MREDSMFLMFEGESSDESDDSNDAEDGTDLDCKIHKLDAGAHQKHRLLNFAETPSDQVNHW